MLIDANFVTCLSLYPPTYTYKPVGFNNSPTLNRFSRALNQ